MASCAVANPAALEGDDLTRKVDSRVIRSAPLRRPDNGSRPVHGRNPAGADTEGLDYLSNAAADAPRHCRGSAACEASPRPPAAAKAYAPNRRIPLGLVLNAIA